MGIFAFAWAAAIVFHFHWLNELPTTLDQFTDAGVVLLALAVLFRPRVGTVFFAMTALQLVTYAIHSPNVSNHYMILTFVNAIIFVGYCAGLARDRRSPSESFEMSLPPVRWMLISIYFWSVCGTGWNVIKLSPRCQRCGEQKGRGPTCWCLLAPDETCLSRRNGIFTKIFGAPRPYSSKPIPLTRGPMASASTSYFGSATTPPPPLRAPMDL